MFKKEGTDRSSLVYSFRATLCMSRLTRRQNLAASTSFNKAHWLNTHVKESQWLDSDDLSALAKRLRMRRSEPNRGKDKELRGAGGGMGKAASSLVTLCSFDFIVSPARISFLTTCRILKRGTYGRSPLISHFIISFILTLQSVL